MDYQQRKQEENEAVAERYALILERIKEITSEQLETDALSRCFQKNAAFILQAAEILEKKENGILEQRSLAECEQTNEELFSDILPKNYETSFANPAYAVAQLTEVQGRMLSFLTAELYALIPYAFEGCKYEFTIFCELFVEVFNCFEQEPVSEKELDEIIRSFYHDYSEVFAQKRVEEQCDPAYDFFTRIVMESDLSSPQYLYQYGTYIGENERKMAEFFNQFSEEEIQSMADTFTEGYRIGFEMAGKDLSKKQAVNIRYPIGFERMIRAAIKNFEKMGLKPTIYRGAFDSFQGRMNGRNGVYAVEPNRQFTYDHKADSAIYLDKAFVERRLESYHTAYEQNKEKAHAFAGPAVMEIFGEKTFEPVNKKEALQYDEKQQKLNVYYRNELNQMVNQYIPSEERSFTIIAYPIPEIGKDFESIFRKTVEINTLDYKKYQTMQQKIIDVLDTAKTVHITGKGKNHTDLYVQLHTLSDPAKQTNFENCVADVNIPVGEVFTSPILTGTNGVLHVTQVYLNELQYLDLELEFEDGKIKSYTCKNFPTEEENKAYIKENVLFQHETLPIGEFAIGTNTTAYRMARDFDIAEKMPILIAEKTGPHFAVGDTCYSQEEDVMTYNPDGKAIVARDNEITLLRKEDPSKAYFNCHTDITIPYDELGAITAIHADGSTADIILDGRFVVPGCEELNEPLD
ncbi:MAG: aminopeptidase [Lachnospiraceae bacterium]